MSRRSSDRIVALLLAIATASTPLAFATTACADPSAADLDTARELYKAGLELRKNGDERGALAKFKAAYALSKSPVIGVDVGKSHTALGELVEAREQYLDIDALPVSAKEGKASVDARAEASKLAAELKPRIPSIKVLLSGTTVPAPKVTIDGTTIPPEAIGQPRAVNPGAHTVGVSNGGPETTVNVTLKEGEVREVPLVAPEATGATPTPVPTPTPTPTPTTTTTTAATSTAPTSDAGGHTTSPLVYLGFGLAGAGLVVGSITGVLALSKASTVKNECPHSVCPASKSSDLDQVKTMALISDIGFAAAGAGIVLGIIGLTTSGKGEEPKNKAHVTPFIGAGSFGVTGAF